MNVQELRQQSIEELNGHLLSLNKELFNLRMQQSTGQLSQTHLIKQAKRNIAQVKTVMGEKEAAGK